MPAAKRRRAGVVTADIDVPPALCRTYALGILEGSGLRLVDWAAVAHSWRGSGCRSCFFLAVHKSFTLVKQLCTELDLGVAGDS